MLLLPLPCLRWSVQVVIILVRSSRLVQGAIIRILALEDRELLWMEKKDKTSNFRGEEKLSVLHRTSCLC